MTANSDDRNRSVDERNRSIYEHVEAELRPAGSLAYVRQAAVIKALQQGLEEITFCHRGPASDGTQFDEVIGTSVGFLCR